MKGMTLIVILVLIALVGPLSLRYGVDSRSYRDSDRRSRWL